MSDTDVKDLIGRPFEPGGRGPGSYDCWGLAMEVCRRRGVILPDFAYGPELDKSYLHGLVASNKRCALELERPEPWCLVTFSMIPGYESHIGTVLPDRRRFIHIRRRNGAIISRLNDLFWKPRIRGFYRWTG